MHRRLLFHLCNFKFRYLRRVAFSVQTVALFADRQLRVTDDIDEENVGDLQFDLFLPSLAIGGG
jgi:hypothetical protein